MPMAAAIGRAREAIAMPANSPRPAIQPAPADESPTQRLDRLLHKQVSDFSGGLSPVSQSLALADWAWHLALSPGRPATA